MSDIVFKRTGTYQGGAPAGELKIGDKSWPTIERGGGYTWVRAGTYTLEMDIKRTGRKVQCLRFDHDGIRTHLIHDALGDSHYNLQGCIAPGRTKTEDGIQDSAEAMKEVFLALGGFTQDALKTITVENNIAGDETGEQWMRRRQSEGKY